MHKHKCAFKDLFYGSAILLHYTSETTLHSLTPHTITLVTVFTTPHYRSNLQQIQCVLPFKQTLAATSTCLSFDTALLSIFFSIWRDWFCFTTYDVKMLKIR